MCYQRSMSAPPARRAPQRDLILAAHTFPGEYVIKAFGPGRAAFRERVTASAHAVLEAHRVVVSERSTKSGTRTCITLTLAIAHVDEIEAVYERIYELEDLMLIL